MRITQVVWGIYSASNRRTKIDPQPQYQRGLVWGQHQKELLIDSILRGYDIPKLYLRALNSGAPYEHEVVDGQQRLRAIWDFKDNVFPLGDRSNDLEGFPPQEGKLFKDLPSELQERFLGFTLAIAEIRDAEEVEIRELFLRLQEGKSLNPAEKRNAMLGAMRDFIKGLAEDHPVFKRTRIKPERFEWDNLAAHVVCIEIAGGPTDVKAENLRLMYANHHHFDVGGSVAKKVKKVLSYMEKCFKDDTPELDIKWGFVDIYQAISLLSESYDIKNRHAEIRGVYSSFEIERRSISDPADLLEGTPSWSDRDLYEYIVAFIKDGGLRKNLEIRRGVYVNRLHDGLPDLLPVDSTRNFSSDQRLIIWRRDSGTCRQCNVDVAFTNMHADHIVPHTSGGKTTVENGQCLCAPCNLSKGAAVAVA
ncbi:MAG: DUF262 domain-containing protein [Rhodocyclaceae bacterium]|nr:DUF262 domain-containing protein [Rhodocyclaceae bacterium]MCA3081289.1 DUF262 domain-containing protein [Rhodocyclaceae bacterium]